ncbi:hypothetical protein HELRODRAFT_174094 [Helobdella robusta]|uniref:non-specific serine/threonine protein kinase n=1 Tax=Helobdella robusta TaxID=6412 RepID=T1F7L5_HELRO|nr:hypothetical protein HELRODRAFT_174094 [Helobdella robusta]ESO03194.1 hypothetical protein HELRODRAFT_174094 [Helobdella robusta]
MKTIFGEKIFSVDKPNSNIEEWKLHSIENRRSSKSFSMQHRSRKMVSDSRRLKEKRRWSVDRSAGLAPNSVLTSSVNKIHFKQLLGAGGFGSVYLGTASGQIVAVKQFHKNVKNARAKEESFLAECRAAQLKHPNIVEVLAASPSQSLLCPPQKTIMGCLSPIPQSPFLNGLSKDSFLLLNSSQPTEQNSLIIMEYAGKKNLLTVINDPYEKISFNRKIRFCQDIISAITYIHDSGIMHLDLKPSNVIVTSDDRCKLGDFGCCEPVQYQDKTSNRKRTSSLAGTVAYTAPELFKGKLPTPKADIYSFAITMWQLTSRKIPYHGRDQHEIIFKVVSSNLRPDYIDEVQCHSTSNYEDTEFKMLYERAWSADPDLRPTAREVKSLLDQMTCSC